MHTGLPAAVPSPNSSQPCVSPPRPRFSPQQRRVLQPIFRSLQTTTRVPDANHVPRRHRRRAPLPTAVGCGSRGGDRGGPPHVILRRH